MMIFDQFAILIERLLKNKTTKEVARIFGKERKWVYSIKNGCCFHLDYNVICGLNKLGYDIKIVKKKEVKQ